MNLQASVRKKVSHLQAVAKKFAGHTPDELHKGKITAAKPKTAPFPFNRDYRKRKRPL